MHNISSRVRFDFSILIARFDQIFGINEPINTQPISQDKSLTIPSSIMSIYICAMHMLERLWSRSKSETESRRDPIDLEDLADLEGSPRISPTSHIMLRRGGCQRFCHLRCRGDHRSKKFLRQRVVVRSETMIGLQ